MLIQVTRLFSLCSGKGYWFWLLAWTVLISSQAKLHGQTLNFRNFTTREGLISDEVYDLFQDKQGYIWVFSKFGALKFNGSEFKPVLTNLPARESFIYTLFERPDGRKWVSNSNAHIFEVRNDSAIRLTGFEKVSAELKDKVAEIGRLIVDDSLNIYAITKGPVYKLLPKYGGYKPVRFNPETKRDSVVFKLYDAGHGEVFSAIVASSNYEFIVLPGRKYLQVAATGVLLPLPFEQQSKSYVNVKAIGKHVYFHHGNLFCWTDYTQVSCVDLQSMIICYTRDSRGYFWVGTNEGLYELNERGAVVGHYLANALVPDVLVDRDGGLWVTTEGQGLFYCRDLKSRGFSRNTPLGEQISFLKVQNNMLFAGTVSGELYFTRGDSMKRLARVNGAVARDILNDGKHSVALYNHTFQKLDLSGSPRVVETHTIGMRYRVFKQSLDTTIYFWSRGLLFSVKGRDAKMIDYGQRLLCGDLIRDTLWIGTQNGAFIVKPTFKTESVFAHGLGLAERGQLQELPQLAPLRNIGVSAIAQDQRGRIWFCSQGEGLFCLAGSVIRHYSTKTGLPSDIVNSVSFTPDQNMLLSTNKGLFMSRDLFDERGPRSWTLLLEGNTKQAMSFNKSVYVSGREGLTILSDVIQNTNKLPSFFLRSVRVDSLLLKPVAFKSLPYGAALRLQFDLVCFDTQRPMVRYRLAGELADSGQANNNLAIELKRLNPGSYTLTAYPDLAGGRRATVDIPFVVEPAYWQTAWFYMACFLLLSLIIGVGGSWVLRYNNRKQTERARNEQLIEEYKLIALKAQVNPHFMSNCLAAIQSIILSGEMESAAFYVARFGLMVREILNLSSRSLVPLQQELNVLELYLEMEKLRFKFAYDISVDGGIRAGELYVPSLILNPIVENAIWHGLMALSDNREKRVDIRVEVTNERLAIHVIDNGAGRGGQKKPSAKGNKSYGLQITADRLNNLNYIYQTQDASMEIRDLVDPNGLPTGTEVIIYLPLGLSDDTL